jgi:hypothetical protein
MIMCKFWNETGEILPFLLLLDCFCDAEKAGRTRDEATAHPQDNHQNSTSIIPKFTTYRRDFSLIVVFSSAKRKMMNNKNSIERLNPPTMSLGTFSFSTGER